MHSNDYATVQSLPRWWWSSSLHSLSRRSLNSFTSWICEYGRPFLEGYPDAVVHRIQIWRIGWPHLWRDKLLASLSAAWWQCMVNGMISVTSSLRHQVYCTQRSKFTGIWLVFICKLCTKNHKKSVHICKSYCLNKCVSKTHISPYAQLIPGGVVHGPLKGSKSYIRCL